MQLRTQCGLCVTGPAIEAGATGPSLIRFVEMPVGQPDFPYSAPMMFGVEGGALECGHGSGAPVTPAYAPPLEFAGTIDSVKVDVSGELVKDAEAEMRQIMPRQ